ncbi:hypothetical protein NDU88_006365 [Pleurodeles waltl]|uniref:Uncharacterized protein n=1 Tax=Pleurodeles waltl TaxID=8319 RepID=A0AAV7WXE7_PLEWA|nr:hypothetical protein NDU88_006365 [Pleurodeles waltl]
MGTDPKQCIRWRKEPTPLVSADKGGAKKRGSCPVPKEIGEQCQETSGGSRTAGHSFLDPQIREGYRVGDSDPQLHSGGEGKGGGRTLKPCLEKTSVKPQAGVTTSSTRLWRTEQRVAERYRNLQKKLNKLKGMV